MFRRNVAAAKITAGLAGMILAGVTLTAGVPVGSDPGPGEGPSTSTGESLEGMKILMTNDDSMQASRENNSDGLGLYEMRKALCEAGADVVIVAPWAVQSGRGTAVTNSGTMTPAEAPAIPEEYTNDCGGADAGGAVFGLCLEDGPCTAESASATPSDTVKFSMRGGLENLVGWSEGPDLVVTGPNSGLNLASSVTDSGTIGAAVAALESHVPVVAFSTAGYNDNSGFPQENYAATSQWAVEFIEGLGSEGLLDQHEFAVSVNYPNISEGTPAG
ncbi:hypothetical protein FCK90_10590 [Kocuria coralli]|uniref:5'-nucleotidase n=1 Tax=Kocuria coralli TaxID=1461025 RepID=A0A5J5KVS1_9MICC|nr:5'/3'-nucleotidase SurE [Kocuria coralli]KAA9393632.1 hypothetical protein FCK90_10590 [Kocuria coralli]